MPYTNNGPVSLYWEEHGEGPPLVMIVGLGADISVWPLHLDHYKKHFRCILVENRGIGKSDKPPAPYTTEDMAGDVAAVMDAAGVDKAHILGVSMGGAIAQAFALAHKARVLSLVLVSTWAKQDNYGKMIWRHFKNVRAHVRPEQWVETLQLWIWAPRSIEADPESMAAAREGAAVGPNPQPDHGFEGQCDASIAHDSSHRLGEIEAPTLITVGDKDIFTPPHMSEALHKGIPNARLDVYEGWAHVHHFEDVERFNRTTTEFMLEHSS
ncbi:alpha/beta fold hydrolase [Pseudohoeflea coraliihabitans]|uniref:Alpha/beta hydrolase n=1 Tax=Pseudohoeflea coraliihabitans TaxID=2860393 RepID=A0ABS6WLQ2_9HYPH|nr:alpha/beta fold hydrolase [Pseudohoeflea sp. DP4N28-3]MBW3095999.1 alpha/beta hydrolase [Pseudohoeflea sp. DP4N28-3]